MFERYTEKARRTIFFARYEASQFGSLYIETEHLLLGLLREDIALTHRFLRPHTSVELIRKQIEDHTTRREKISTAIDLPLSNECKHVLAYAAEESERLSHNFIGTEHLLLGILMEKECFAAQLLRHSGVEADAVRKHVQDSLVPIPRLHAERPSGIGASAGVPACGFFQLVLRVTDLDTSIQFYTNLGFIQASPHNPNGTVLINGNCNLRLEQSPMPEHALTFLGVEMTSAVSRLEAAGISYEKVTGPHGSLTALVRDPDGNAISLQFQFRSNPPAPPTR